MTKKKLDIIMKEIFQNHLIYLVNEMYPCIGRPIGYLQKHNYKNNNKAITIQLKIVKDKMNEQKFYSITSKVNESFNRSPIPG